MKPEQIHKTFGIANKYILIGIVVFLSIGISAWGVGSMVTADNSNLGDVLTVSYSGTDTATVQAYFNTSGISEIILSGDMTIGAITVPSNIHKISGTATIRQTAAGANGFNVAETSNLTIEGLTFIGQGGNYSASPNTAIRVSNSTNIFIRNNYMSGWRHLAVWVSNTTSFEVIGNKINNNSHGIRVDEGRIGKINFNTLNRSQYQNFSVAIGLQERGASDCAGCGNGGSNNIEIVGNQILNWDNSQGILIHDCIRCNVENNYMYSVFWGASISSFATADNLTDISFKNNYIKGTSSWLYPDALGNQCITFDSSPSGKNGTNISIIGNTCVDNNKVLQTWNNGAITFRNGNDSTISGNHIVNPYATGIFLYGYSWNISVTNNDIQNVTSVPANAGIGIYSYTGIQSGIISYNTVQETFDGIEYDTTSPNLWIVFNSLQARSAAVHAVGSVGKVTHNAGADI